MRYLVNMKYDGTLFYGLEKQNNFRTVTGVIEEVLSKIFNEKIKIVGCSRTDKGVHANDYYFHFDTDKNINTDKLKHSINSIIDRDIYIKEVKQVTNEIHARYSVKNKEYKYIINTKEYEPTMRNYRLEYNKPINIKILKKVSKKLIGEHNFKAFTSDKDNNNYIRKINYIKIKKDKNLLYIYINSNGFLRYMVRNIIGLMLEVNEGKKSIDEVEEILEKQDRRNLGVMVSSSGLYLNKVNY